MYDTIVVGARCAGAPLAMLLARRGARVLLLDRATFPSDIPHGHFIHRHGPRRLKRWGLLDRIAANTPSIASLVVDLGDFALTIRDVVEDGVAWGYGPRRSTLDKILVDAAIEAGAELRAGFTVDEYLFDGDRVIGIRGRDAGGAVFDERATLVVGADGRNSRLAKTVRASAYNETSPLLCYYFSYWSGVEAAPFELYARHEQHRVIFSFRTEDRLFATFVGFRIEEFPQVRANTESAFMSALDLAGDFGARIRAGRREERFYGASDLPNFYRKAYGPGWALVGHAGIHKDPYLALGICDAFRDVELLAAAVGDGLNGRREMDVALGEYERQRDVASASEYNENIAMARFQPIPPQVRVLRAALRENPAEATRFWKTREGMFDPAERLV